MFNPRSDTDFHPACGPLLRALFAGLFSWGIAAASPLRAESIVENGTFDHAEGPFHGWNIDYEWTGNRHYVGNKERVSVIDSEGGKSKVVAVRPAGDAGAKMECVPIPFEKGFRYKASLDVKGGPYRIYFAGYKWQPGIRPHEAPELGELRLIYKSKAHAAQSGDWDRVEIELPGVALSSQAKAHLKEVRFVTLYIWLMKPGFVDNVSVEKTADPSVDF